LDIYSIPGNLAIVVGKVLIFASTKQDFQFAIFSTNDEENATFVVDEWSRLTYLSGFMNVGFNPVHLQHHLCHQSRSWLQALSLTIASLRLQVSPTTTKTCI